MRKLASIQKIIDIQPIPEADRIEMTRILGWECVIQKNTFKKDDLCIYIEVDSILPDDLLKQASLWDNDKNIGKLNGSKGNRLKTKRLKKQISQGLVLPLKHLPTDIIPVEDMDVTTILNIIKYDLQIIEENDLEVKSNSKLLKFFMKFWLFRKIYLLLNSKLKGNFPSWIKKTDEDNINTIPKYIDLYENEDFYVTEKAEGQSFTAFYHSTKVWGFKKWLFGVCSRNIWLKTENNSNYWKIANKYKIKDICKKINKNIVIQGEIVGPNIQGNIYKLTELDLYVFNIIIDSERLDFDTMVNICNTYGLKHVPIIHKSLKLTDLFTTDMVREDKIKTLIKYADGESLLYKTKREGLVWRMVKNTNISFKTRSLEYLLDHDLVSQINKNSNLNHKTKIFEFE